MIGDKKEIFYKKQLTEAMGKMQRNISGVGSIEILKEKYPTAYNRLDEQIKELTRDYVMAAIHGIGCNDKVPKDEVEAMWKAARKNICGARKRLDADEITKHCSDFICDVFVKWPGGNVWLTYDLPEDEAEFAANVAEAAVAS